MAGSSAAVSAWFCAESISRLILMGSDPLVGVAQHDLRAALRAPAVKRADEPGVADEDAQVGGPVPRLRADGNAPARHLFAKAHQFEQRHDEVAATAHVECLPVKSGG